MEQVRVVAARAPPAVAFEVELAADAPGKSGEPRGHKRVSGRLPRRRDSAKTRPLTRKSTGTEVESAGDYREGKARAKCSRDARTTEVGIRGAEVGSAGDYREGKARAKCSRPR
jgi:hypothetical protein